MYYQSSSFKVIIKKNSLKFVIVEHDCCSYSECFIHISHCINQIHILFVNRCYMVKSCFMKQTFNFIFKVLNVIPE